MMETTAAAAALATDSMKSPATSDSIVVGHDGSAGAAHALEYALGLAERLGAPVVVVRSWTVDRMPRASNFEHGYVSSFAEVSATVRESLIAETHLATTRRPTVPVEYRGVLAHPAEALVAISRDALMLVVGSRGLGDITSVLLGSVSDHCARQATCPVLVVKPRAAD